MKTAQLKNMILQVLALFLSVGKILFDLIFKQRAAIYGGGYIALIFVFSFIYSTIESELHYGTLEHEKSPGLLRQLLVSSLSRKMDINLAQNCSKKKYYEKKWTICESLPQVEIIDIEESIVKFKVDIGANDHTPNKRQWARLTAVFLMSEKDGLNSMDNDILTIAPRGRVAKVVIITDRESGSEDANTNGAMKQLFDSVLSLDSDTFAIFMPKDFDRIIKSFILSRERYPLNIDSTIIRMFYFSVVTQTTLGYGDIVPISDRARALVGLQTLFGVILIGMFLNAVAGQANKK